MRYLVILITNGDIVHARQYIRLTQLAKLVRTWVRGPKEWNHRYSVLRSTGDASRYAFHSLTMSEAELVRRIVEAP